MAVKIVRQPNKLVLLGVPTSAAALYPGREGGPSALRAAGLISRLESVGYKVNDLGDDAAIPYRQGDESPRARNLRGVIACLEALKPRVEQAVKSGALPIIIGGDNSIALGTVAGVRRYFRNVGMIFMDSYARLLTPASTPNGSLDGMVVSHLTGRGAAELVRFWGEPPLVRDPNVALFGVDQLQPSEEEVCQGSPLRLYLAADVRKTGIASAATAAIDRIHSANTAFILHVGVTAIANFDSADDPSTGGLRLEEVKQALDTFVKQPHLAAMEVTGYDPARDPNGSGANAIIDLLAAAFAARREASEPSSVPVEAPPAAGARPTGDPIELIPAAKPGETWSSEARDLEMSNPQLTSPEITEEPEP